MSTLPWDSCHESASTMTLPEVPGPRGWMAHRPRIEPNMTEKKLMYYLNLSPHTVNICTWGFAIPRAEALEVLTYGFLISIIHIHSGLHQLLTFEKILWPIIWCTGCAAITAKTNSAHDLFELKIISWLGLVVHTFKAEGGQGISVSYKQAWCTKTESVQSGLLSETLFQKANQNKQQEKYIHLKWHWSWDSPMTHCWVFIRS